MKEVDGKSGRKDSTDNGAKDSNAVLYCLVASYSHLTVGSVYTGTDLSLFR